MFGQWGITCLYFVTDDVNVVKNYLRMKNKMHTVFLVYFENIQYYINELQLVWT